MPEIAQVARVQVEQIANVSSTDITIANWLTLANRINAIYERDPSVAGVVITHGTNTLEETGRPTNRRRASPIRSSPAPRRLRICLDESSCVGAGSARAAELWWSAHDRTRRALGGQRHPGRTGSTVGAAAWRAEVVPRGIPTATADAHVEASASDVMPRPSARGSSWADLMRRAFEIDVLACPRCGGRLRPVALIEVSAVSRRILDHLGLPADVPRPAPARAPPISVSDD